jgi:hypothetical protein
MLLGNDVLHLEGQLIGLLRHLAIFAAPVSPIPDYFCEVASHALAGVAIGLLERLSCFCFPD